MPHKDPEKRRQYQRDYWKNNPQYQLKQRKRIYKRRDEIIKWFQELKTTLACSKCDEAHPACLHFHHLDPSSKSLEISIAVVHGWSIDRLKKEIAKCSVLCANCHAKEHWGSRWTMGAN